MIAKYIKRPQPLAAAVAAVFPQAHPGVPVVAMMEEPEFVPIVVVPDENSPHCQLCGKPAFELRPFGPNHESICEACSELDPVMTERRYHDMNPNG